MLVLDDLYENDNNNKEKLLQIFTEDNHNRNYTTIPGIMIKRLNLTYNLDSRISIERSRVMG